MPLNAPYKLKGVRRLGRRARGRHDAGADDLAGARSYGAVAGASASASPPLGTMREVLGRRPKPRPALPPTRRKTLSRQTRRPAGSDVENLARRPAGATRHTDGLSQFARFFLSRRARRRLGEDLRVPVDVRLGGRGRHQGHVVERRQQDAAVEDVEVQVALERRSRPPRAPRCRSAAGRARSRYSARQPSRVTCHGSPRSAIASATPASKRSASAIMCSNASSVSTSRERRADRRERERVARERAADPADVGLAPERVVDDPLGDLGAHSVGAAGIPPAIGLPIVSTSGSRPWAAV